LFSAFQIDEFNMYLECFMFFHLRLNIVVQF
jgi:hypothetical protein